MQPFHYYFRFYYQKYQGKDSWRLMFAIYDYNNDKKITLSDLSEICEEIMILKNEKINLEFKM